VLLIGAKLGTIYFVSSNKTYASRIFAKVGVTDGGVLKPRRLFNLLFQPFKRQKEIATQTFYVN
jgi:hypothetical protein